ncbi:hypothetical protein AMECASPLE_038489 [Ameca splendens]|uniref:Secreted protein n=1 Tax=Ameca splendens TaxID=208324 RepID=A0ABV0YVG7_9TELE
MKHQAVSSHVSLLLLHAAHFAYGCFTQCHIYCNPGFTLYLLRSGPLRSPEELQEPYADRSIKAGDKCGSKSQTSNSLEVKPLHFSFYASRYFHVFGSLSSFVAQFGAFNV